MIKLFDGRWKMRSGAAIAVGTARRWEEATNCALAGRGLLKLGE
jgi:hypothetical protein